jgi:hypothetical protein
MFGSNRFGRAIARNPGERGKFYVMVDGKKHYKIEKNVQKTNHPELHSVEHLQAYCRAHGISGYSSLAKAALWTLITKRSPVRRSPSPYLSPVPIPSPSPQRNIARNFRMHVRSPSFNTAVATRKSIIRHLTNLGHSPARARIYVLRHEAALIPTGSVKARANMWKHVRSPSFNTAVATRKSIIRHLTNLGHSPALARRIVKADEVKIASTGSPRVAYVYRPANRIKTFDEIIRGRRAPSGPSRTVTDLRKMCKNKGITGYSKMKKANLVRVLSPHRSPITLAKLMARYASPRRMVRGNAKANVEEM